MFAYGEVTFENGMHIICRTNYPYSFEVNYEVVKGGCIAIRIPAWSKEYTVKKNGTVLAVEPEKGYVYIDVNSADKLDIILDSAPLIIPGATEELIRCVSGCRGCRRKHLNKKALPYLYTSYESGILYLLN